MLRAQQAANVVHLARRPWQDSQKHCLDIVPGVAGNELADLLANSSRRLGPSNADRTLTAQAARPPTCDKIRLTLLVLCSSGTQLKTCPTRLEEESELYETRDAAEETSRSLRFAKANVLALQGGMVSINASRGTCQSVQL